MAATSTPAADQEALGGKSGQCSTLMNAATPDVFLKNSFRITGLAIDVSARDIAKQLAERKLRAELGDIAEVRSSLFPRESPPTLELIREAEQRLRDPEQRIVDELFWFWPVEQAGSKSDPALLAVAAGDTARADKLWRTLEGSPDKGVIAIHNVAVRWHLTALGLEKYWNREKSDDKALQTLSKCWLYALKRWDQLLTDDAFWHSIAARVTALDDPRLTSGFVRRMRSTLPYALANINAMLAVKHAEADANDLVVMHVRLLRDSHLILAAPGEFATLVLNRAKENVRHHIQIAREHSESSPKTAIEAAQTLVRCLALYERLFSVLGYADNSSAHEILDEGVDICITCAVISNRQTQDELAFVDLMERALPLAKGSATRERAHKNLAAGRSSLIGAALDPLYKVLMVIRDSTDSPKARLGAFERDALPLLTKALEELPKTEESRSTVSDAAAQLLKGIAIDAWNKGQDGVTSTVAIKQAIQYACSEELKKRLYEDFATLTQLVKERRALDRKKKLKGLAWVCGVTGLVLWSVWGNSPNPTRPTAGPATSSVDSSLPSAPEPLQAVPEPGAAEDSSRTYRVPGHMVGELHRQLADITIQKQRSHQLEREYDEAQKTLREKTSTAEALEFQVHALREQLDRAKPFVDQSDPASLAAFNSSVDQYNALLRRARARRAAANELVDPFNALAERVNAQNREVNQMVDAYNNKLARASN